ncbi:MAG: nicotinate-nucleotide adenylyltransferase [Bacteroidales bacterium]|nr:nicotinate-nucleotide adenylyltransferase [Bacteroidales bacterium]
MKTGLFFGSFNPIHIGHMALANYFTEYTDLNQVWFIISPHNPLKSKKSLLNDQFRLEMAELAIGNDERFAICDIEFRMPKPSYTIDTLTYLSEKHPKKEFILLMGSDSLETFHKWKNHEQIIHKYHRYIYPRNTNKNTDYSQHLNITFLKNAPRIEISSSFIRKALKEERDVRYFLSNKVYDFIIRNHLYQ